MEDPNIAATEHLFKAMGGPPHSTATIGRWSALGWDTTDSTNSRALQALKSAPQHSLDHFAIHVNEQTAGRGQQQRAWTQEANRDLVMTLILTRNLPAAHPFALNLAISLAVLEGIGDALPAINVDGLEIKWPNDIMWRGRKAGGVLIENSWRGSHWASAVIGIGVNVAGAPPYPNATPLQPEIENAAHTIENLRRSILQRSEQRLAEMTHPQALLQQFHQRLHGWGQLQRWQLDGHPVRGILESIDIEGRLCVSENGVKHCFSPGEVGWLGLEPRAGKE